MAIDLDQKNLDIIKILEKNARTSNVEIAKKINISEGAVRRRINLLIKGNFIRLVGITNPLKMGFHTEALIGIKVDTDQLPNVEENLNTIEKIRWQSSTTGSFDIFIWVALQNQKQLGSFILTIGKIPGVQRTETFVSLGKFGDPE